MKKDKPKRITMDKLALMIGKGFNDMDEKFKKVDEKFKKVNERMDKGFADLEKKIEDTKDELKVEINKKVDIFTHKSLEIQVEKLEEKVKLIHGK